MAADKTGKKKTTKGTKNLVIFIIILILFFGIPFLFLNYQARKSGMSMSQVLQRKINRTSITDSLPGGQLTTDLVGEKIDFLIPGPIGQTFTEQPQISNVTVADLDGDGLPDIIVCDTKSNFVSWIRQYPAGVYTEKNLATDLMAPAHVQVIDYDKDGDKDIMVAVLGMLYPSNDKIGSVVILENDGKGNFQLRLLWGSNNEDFGSSGIYVCDLNQDGKQDILYTNGDAFDYIPPRGRPWHGVQWLENKGNLNLEFHRVCNFIGSYSARPADIDNDGDIDIFAVSGFNLWDNPQSQSFIWLENIGNMQFKKHDIASSPTHLITLEPGDFNNDGLTDFVTGGIHAYPPYDRMGRVTLWMNNGGLMSGKK